MKKFREKLSDLDSETKKELLINVSVVLIFIAILNLASILIGKNM